MKKAFSGIMLVLMFIDMLTLAFNAQPTQGDQKLMNKLEFQTISKGFYSGHRSPAYYVILNEDEWADVWNQHYSIFWPQLPPPEVNFSESIIIAVFMGEFSTGGYGIEIKEILDMNQSVVVRIEKTYPFGFVTTALSQPYHIVKMDKINKEIIFQIVGDITGPEGFPDGKVDFWDLAMVARNFGIVHTDSRYDPNCDITYDGKIDIKDIFIVAKNLGKTL